MEQEKQYNLLRPFNKEQVLEGKPICYNTGEAVQYVAGPDVNGDVCVWFDPEQLCLPAQWILRMTPLTWVEGKPVYAGDVLYWNSNTHSPGSKFTVGSKMLDINLIEGVSVLTDGRVYDTPRKGMPIEGLTWTRVKKEGWLNIYPGDRLYSEHMHPTEAAANAVADDTRLACVRVEWEE